ncbi:MAG: hypothetical protein LBJ67_09035 [Planctomycetaceae bacterium]|nr:hypothetical protein [Planctomycetaceae bacterium]
MLPVIVIVFASCEKSVSPLSGVSFSDSVKIREFPFKKISHKRPLIELTEQEKEFIWNFASLPTHHEELGLSYILHYLKVYAEKPEQYQKETEYLLSVIQKEDVGKNVLGTPVFFTSKFGISIVSGKTKRSQETHRDQGMAELGLLGIPSSFEVEISEKIYPLSDAIRECAANFYLEEKELAWSAIVLALYLPPIQEWTNRFGEKCSFDALAIELMKQRFEENSCAGAHLLESLTLIYEISLECPILSFEVQNQLKKYLHDILTTVIHEQNIAGYWELDWFVKIPDYGQPFQNPHVWTPSVDSESRLLATCHLVEWMLDLPEEFDVPNETLKKAGMWMLNHLKTKKYGENTPICPYAHVVRDLELLGM